MTKAGLNVAEKIAHLHGQKIGGEGAGIPPALWKSGPSDLRFSHPITPQHHDGTRPACKPLTPGPWRYCLNTNTTLPGGIVVWRWLNHPPDLSFLSCPCEGNSKPSCMPCDCDLPLASVTIGCYSAAFGGLWITLLSHLPSKLSCPAIRVWFLPPNYCMSGLW